MTCALRATIAVLLVATTIWAFRGYLSSSVMLALLSGDAFCH
jgi:hypothetical protein